MRIDYMKVIVTLVAKTPHAALLDFGDDERHWIPLSLLSADSQDLVEETLADKEAVLEVRIQKFKLDQLGIL